MKSEYTLGCLKPAHDDRDYQFDTLLTNLAFFGMPKEYIPKERVVPFNQDKYCMCCACAVAMSRYIYERKDSKVEHYFSPGYIYANRVESSIVDGVYTGEGMYLKDAMKGLIVNGCPSYDSFSGFGYYKNLKIVYSACKDKIDTEAYPYRASSYYAVKTDREIKKAILTTGSVLASFMVTSGWYDADETGIIPTYGNIEGGHAVLIVGWRVINNKLYWVILNSWGDQWGDKGYGYIESTEMVIESYCILDEVHEV